eukprot:CAMPEP_0116872122 /NCGR_PEP_ID=MMETSP0463-20121206/2785_1 /TAXON_ID=181622 /ORGANISM="Strombidinopsis sp, Strain SopsisLIS2011" /LENGTH=64 /DNA_ID=CAMNT_0004511853 /DNA_START=1812 /DNA_END=2006 /DNA_ORIENTATION=-
MEPVSSFSFMQQNSAQTESQPSESVRPAQEMDNSPCQEALTTVAPVAAASNSLSAMLGIKNQQV